jgi:hypothetical protein
MQCVKHEKMAMHAHNCILEKAMLKIAGGAFFKDIPLNAYSIGGMVRTRKPTQSNRTVSESGLSNSESIAHTKRVCIGSQSKSGLRV